MDNHANSFATLLLVAFIIILLVIAVAVLSQPQTTSPVTLTPSPTPTTTPYEGTAQLISNTSGIQWGTLQKGSVYIQHMELSNIGDAPTIPLNMTSTCNVGAFTWSNEGLIIGAEEAETVDFTLTVSPNATAGSFNFNIKITY